MVGVAGDDHAPSPRHGAGDPHGQVDGLAPGAREDGLVQRRREQAGEVLGVGDDLIGQIARVSVENAELLADRLPHRRVGVADDRNVVIRVQVVQPVGIEQVSTFPAHQMERAIVEEPVGSAHRCVSSAQKVSLSIPKIGGT